MARHGTALVPCRTEWQHLHCNNKIWAKVRRQSKIGVSVGVTFMLKWLPSIRLRHFCSQALPHVCCRSPALLRAHFEGEENTYPREGRKTCHSTTVTLTNTVHLLLLLVAFVLVGRWIGGRVLCKERLLIRTGWKTSE